MMCGRFNNETSPARGRRKPTSFWRAMAGAGVQLPEQVRGRSANEYTFSIR